MLLWFIHKDQYRDCALYRCLKTLLNVFIKREAGLPWWFIVVKNLPANAEDMVGSLIQEDSTCLGATKLVSPTY